MQVERMRSTNKATGEVDLDSLVSFDNKNATLWKKLLSSPSTTHYLKQDRNSGRLEHPVVDTESEGVDIESQGEVECLISAFRVGNSNCDSVSYGVQVRFNEFVFLDWLVGLWVCNWGANISKDGRVDTVFEG